MERRNRVRRDAVVSRGPRPPARNGGRTLGPASPSRKVEPAPPGGRVCAAPSRPVPSQAAWIPRECARNNSMRRTADRLRSRAFVERQSGCTSRPRNGGDSWNSRRLPRSPLQETTSNCAMNAASSSSGIRGDGHDRDNGECGNAVAAGSPGVRRRQTGGNVRLRGGFPAQLAARQREEHIADVTLMEMSNCSPKA